MSVTALCDPAIAADNLQFSLSEIRFNMYPVIVHAVLEEKISPALAVIAIGQRALRIARSSGVSDRIARLAPLMHENFSRPGVREAIAQYFKR